MSSYSRRALSVALVSSMLLVAGAASAQVIVERAMPAPLVETVPVAPGPGFAWVPGHWVWQGGEWFWARGHYVEGVVPAMPAMRVETPPPPPSPEHRWVRGHYGWEGGGWNWRPGVWVR